LNPNDLPAAEREIFEFRDGAGPRRGDPLAIERRMTKALADVDDEALDEQLRSPVPGIVFDGLDKLLPAIRAAFKVAAFEDDEAAGLTAEETLDLWGRFQDWRDRLKGDTGPTPSTSPPTADAPAAPSASSAGSEST
jgi:hypothetical protein